VARMGGMTGAYRAFVERLGCNITWTTEAQIKTIILKWILITWDGGHSLDCSGSKRGQQAGDC